MSSQAAVVGNSLLGHTSGELALRVSAPASASRTVRLAGGKCTIGSSRNCTLRLRAGGVSPVHCLIVRGEHATVVRRWSADTLLNGRPFTDAELRSGDRLSVGSIEMDVVELGTGQENSRSTTDSLTQPRQPGMVDKPQSDEAGNALEHSLRFLQIEQELATRGEQLAAEWLAVEAARSELAEREAAWTRETMLARADDDHQRQALLTQRESLQQLSASQLDELNQAHRDVDDQRQQMEQERAELQRQQADQWAELARIRRQIDDERQQFAAERTEMRQCEGGAHADLAEREQQLKAAAAELEQARAEFLAEQQELVAEEGEFNEWRARAAEAAEELARQHDALSRERRQLTNRHQQFDKQQAEIREELDAERAAIEQQRLELQVHVATLAEQRKVAEGHAAKAQVDVDVDAVRQELAGAQQELAQHQARVREELEAERAAVQAQRQEFETDAAELAARRQSVEDESAKLTAERQQLDERFVHSREVVDAERATVERQRQELQAEFAALAEQRTSVEELAANLAAERQLLDKRQAQPHDASDADRTELERRRQELQTELAALTELQQAVENEQVQAREAIEAERQQLRREQDQWHQQRDSEPHSATEQSAAPDSNSQWEEQQRIADDERAAERQQWEARLASLTAEIEQLRNLSAEESGRLANEREELRQRHEQIAQQQLELAVEQSRFDEQRAEWDRSQATACDNLILARNMLAEHQTSLEIERRSWEAERQAFDAHRQEFEAQRQVFEAERTARFAEPQADANHEPAHADEAWRQESVAHDQVVTDDEANERPAASVSPTDVEPQDHSRGTPVDSWRSRVDWANEPSEDASEVDDQRQNACTPEPPVGTLANQRTDDRSEPGEEESIEEYMAKLMRRVRGESDQSSATHALTPAAPPRGELASESQRIEQAARVQVEEPVVSNEPAQPFQLVPRNRPPEFSSNLGAMRELANWSAKQAIDTSVRQRWSKAAVSKLLVAITGLVVGTSLLQWSQEFSDIPFMAAMLAYVITVFWLLQGGLIFRNIRKANKLDQDASHAERASEATDSDAEASLVDDDSLATPDEFATDYWAEDDVAAEIPGTVEVDVDEVQPDALRATEQADGDSEK